MEYLGTDQRTQKTICTLSEQLWDAMAKLAGILLDKDGLLIYNDDADRVLAHLFQTMIEAARQGRSITDGVLKLEIDRRITITALPAKEEGQGKK